MATDLARRLRRQASWAEQDFWRLTLSLRQAGWNFRRQQLIGTYYVDFACLHAGLVVEIDGDTHGDDFAQSNDAVRDDYLAGRGFKVLRFTNDEVTANPDGVFDAVVTYLDTRAPVLPPQPSPRGGGSRIAREARSRQAHGPNSGVGEAASSKSDEDHQ